MEPQRWEDRRCSFGGSAALYDRIRPTYPVSAVRWMVEPAGLGPLRVIDLGAGTGILTRALVALGHEVLPVEPDPGMRARLMETTPGVTPLAGSAESIPVPDGSVDAVVAGQAYHWFDPDRAHPEIARVLRPGGVMAPVWNDRDESVDWLARLSAIVDGLVERQGDPHPGPTRTGPWFAPTEHAAFLHSVRHTADSLVELIKSRSYYLTADRRQREEIEAGVRTLVAEHPDLNGAEEFDLPYVTRAFRALRLP